MSKRTVKQPHIRNINVVDLILMDHRVIKEGIEIFTNKKADKLLKITMAKGFLDVLEKHSLAEKVIVYEELESHEEFHFNIIESKVEHAMMDERIKALKPKITQDKILKDEIEAELMVLAELAQRHIQEEEDELLPKMSAEIDEETLKIMGEEFMKARNMGPRDFDELMDWKGSKSFLSKTDNYIENLKQ